MMIGSRTIQVFRFVVVRVSVVAALLTSCIWGGEPPATREPAAIAPLTTMPSPVESPAPAVTRSIDQAAYNQETDNKSAAPGAAAKNGPTEISAAEQITRLEKSMQSDAQRLVKLRDEMVDPMSEYRLAENDYKAAEVELQRAAAELTMPDMLPPEQLATLQQRVEELTKKHKLARQRFDLAIQTRKTLQEQITALENKQHQDQQALDKQSGNPALPISSAPPNSTVPTNNVVPHPAAMTGTPGLLPAAIPQDNSSKPGTMPAPVASTAIPAPVGAAAPAATPAPGAVAAPAVIAAPFPAAPAAEVHSADALAGVLTSTANPPKPPSKELVAAESEAQKKKEIALAAERDAQSVTDRIAALDRDLALENKLLVATRQKADIAYQTSQALGEDLEKRQLTGIAAEELGELRGKRREAEKLFRSARAEVAERVDRLTELQSQRAELHREELAATHEAKSKHAEAQVAEDKVSQLKNPFSIQNLLQWLLDHAPKIAIILLGMYLFRRTLSLANQRVMQIMVMRGARGTVQEREDRAKTLVGVFHNAVSLIILISGTLMICEEVGISVGPLMGGAAVLGLAVAFGAQNLIRDYFYGFVILLENQYKLNDVLKIGEISGQVEQISLRMTVLRDLQGNVHFIPNGKIDSVTNMTHGWSRAVLEVGIGYGEDADRVMLLLIEMVNEMRAEPEFLPQIIDEPEMLGVDELGDSAVTIKLMVKTRPLCQWKVKRELLRRIKRRFDELGIEIPFPQRVVTHRYEQDDAGRQTPDAPPQTHPLRKSA